MDDTEYRTIMFVDTDNTGQSIMAEAIFAAKTINKVIHSISRGLIVLFPEPVNPKAEEVLENHNIKIAKQCSEQFCLEETGEQVLILTMTEKQKEILNTDYGITKHAYTLKEYAGELGDCVDPYGGTLLVYEESYEELARLVKKTNYRLIKENMNSCTED